MPGFLVTSAFFVPVAKLFIDLGESKPPTWFLYGWFWLTVYDCWLLLFNRLTYFRIEVARIHVNDSALGPIFKWEYVWGNHPTIFEPNVIDLYKGLSCIIDRFFGDKRVDPPRYRTKPFFQARYPLGGRIHATSPFTHTSLLQHV